MIRVLLVNEVQLTCNVLAAVLDEEPDIKVVGCTTTYHEALDQAGEADIILVSTELGNREALPLVRAIKEASPAARILVLGLNESQDQVLPYIQAGATGYVLADDSVDDLFIRIRTAYEDRALISPEIAAALMARLGELAQMAEERVGGGNGTARAQLTPREREILELIDRGFTNQQIAEALVIEVGTVKNHVHNILQKLDVDSRQDAAAYLALVPKRSVTEG